MKNPSRSSAAANTVTTSGARRPRREGPLRCNQANLNVEPLFVSETKVWFSHRGHSCMEKKAGPRQVNRMLLSRDKSIVLTLRPHQLWGMLLYSQSVIRRRSRALFKTARSHHRY